MDLAGISPKLLDSYLQAFRQGREKPPELLSLHCVDFHQTNDIEEKHLYLFTWLETLVAKNLKNQRVNNAPTIKYSGMEWRQTLQYDFRNTSIKLQSWSALYYRYFSGETDSFDELALITEFDPRQFRRRLENGLKELTNLIQRLEMEMHLQEERAITGKSIPTPDYIQLFGIASAQLQLQDWLTGSSRPQMISVEGIGGIGKTTLAQSTLEKIFRDGTNGFRDVIWLSARQEMLTARGEIELLKQYPPSICEIVADLAQKLGLSNLAGLDTASKLDGIQRLLQLHPYLIIVDNLENVQEVRALVPMIRKISGKTHFLFTSRRTLGVFPYVQIFTVPQLSIKDSQKLIESEVNRRGKKYQLSNDRAEAIFRMVGGLPLALKLIAAQIFDTSEEYVINRLHTIAPGKSHRALYTYIYKETWKNLRPEAQQLLLSLLLIATGGETLEWIQGNCGMSSDQFEQAFTELRDSSLIEMHFQQEQTKYYLHRLTHSFLKSNILREWNVQ
jgi:hypothetical protein